MRRSPRTRVGVVSLAVVATVAALIATVAPTRPAPSAEAAVPTARFAPLDVPVRVTDTRPPDAPLDRIPAGGSVTIDPVTAQVATSAGVAEGDVVAVVATVTLVDTGGWGFATVWPSGERRPDASSLNADAAGQTVANTVTARLGVDGRIAVFSSTAADLLVDVQGVYVRSEATRAGRFVAVTPRRVWDSRGSGPLPAGATVTVPVAAAGVPASASAVVLNVTAVDALGWGFLTVWDGTGARPVASNVNYLGGSTVANQAIVDLHEGRVRVYSYAAADLLVDVVGYMTGPTATMSTDGLFVPLSPARLLDTRLDAQPTTGAPMGTRSSLSVGTAGAAGLPATGVAAVNTVTTLTETTTTGYLTVWGDGAVPTPSSLNNVGAGRTVANHVISDVTSAGCLNLFSSDPTHVIVDVTGYFVGSTAAPPFAPLDLCDRTLAPPPPQPATSPTAGAHTFMFTAAGTPGGYGRWDPCRPQIRFAVNTLRAGPREIDEMYRALREVELATGFDFVPYRPDPTTTSGLDDRRPPSGADFLVGFADPDATPALGGGVLGIGGGFWFPSSGRIDSGFVIVDVPQLGDRNRLRAALTHEIGHAMGLGHTDDRNELMFGTVTGRTTFGDGDRHGLWRLGTAQTCTGDHSRATEAEAPVLVEETTEGAGATDRSAEAATEGAGATDRSAAASG